MRIGNFKISEKTVEDRPDLALAVMAQVIITRAEFRYIDRSFFYEGISQHFSEVKPGNQIPLYQAVIEQKSPADSIQVRFV